MAGFSSPFVSTPAPQPAGHSFSLQNSQPQQQQVQQIHLLTKEKAPVSYNTKWADLHPDSQNFLLQIETRILEYRDESRRLEQCERLFDSAALNEGFEVDAVRISQDLGGISTAMDRDKVCLQELMKTAKEMMRNTEVAVRSFAILRSRFPRVLGSANSANASNAIMPSMGTGGSGPGQAVASTLSTDFYSGVPTKPSPFLVHTVTRFEHQLQEFRQWVEELERLLFADSEDSTKDGCELSLLQSLPTVIKNIHDFFIHVAAKVETLHQQTWSIRTAYLADQRKRGDDNNPFLEADRREVAKKEAAAKRVHPTLQTLTGSQASSQVAGLLPSGTPATSASTALSNTSLSAFPSFNTSASPVPGTASSSVASSSIFGSSSSLTPSLFGSSSSPSVFGAGPSVGSSSSSLSTFAGASSGGLFGSTSTPLFGGQSTGNIFGNQNQALGTNTGGAFGMGTSQGTANTKAKSRIRRK